MTAYHEIQKDKIEDAFGRQFKVLRVSLTNTCNLACSYCVDPSQTLSKKENRVLEVNQFVKLISALHQIVELETIRLTGGEPILYKNIIPLLQSLRNAGMKDIRMTTNGTLLENKAKDFKEAGLSAVNISLDAMEEKVFAAMNRKQSLAKVLKGIDKALEVGLKVKINCVVMKGENENQVLSLFEYGKERNISIRFLELMQMGHLYHNFENYFFSEEEILRTIAAKYSFKELKRDKNATAKYWITNDGYKFGIISNESDPFCSDCNRLRLDSYGNIYGCLSSNHPVAVLDCLEDETELKSRLMKALKQKQTKFSGSDLSMLHIGG